jgi:predicted SAM-dependent methyltransferase
MKLLNLGCGNRYHKDWINIDFHSESDDVIQHNLLTGIPLPDKSVDVVYHSHVLEHFSKKDSVFFIQENHRVLKVGGIIRIVVPDLEQIAKDYINWLEQAAKGDKNAEANYDWVMLELLDQCVRNEGGGEMGKYIMQDSIINEEFIRDRLGSFFDIIRQTKSVTNGLDNPSKLLVFLRRFSKLRKFWLSIKNTLRNTKLRIKTFIFKFTGEDLRRLGKYRLSGEVHQWMYDRFSLKRLLLNNGFSDVKVLTPFESNIPDWDKYLLDFEANKKIYKPYSLFIEAVKK